MSKCGECVFWENDVCYKKGIRLLFNNNICKDYIKENLMFKDEK